MKKVLSLMLIALLAFSMVACSSEPAQESESQAEGSTAQVIKIGGIGPVTGAAAAYGSAVKNAAELAVDEINAMGTDVQFELNFQDDEHDPEKAVNAYNTLKDWDMQILLGAVTSAPCIAVAAEAEVDNVFLLTPSATAEDAIATDNAFRICFSDPEQGQLPANYFAESEIATKFAVIYDSSDTYSTGIHDAFIAQAESLGLEIVADEAYTADSNTDFNVQLQKAKNAGAELIFLPIYYSDASLILTQADSMGYAPMFFGADGLDGILTVENFDTSLAEGAMLMTPFTASATDEPTVNFVTAYNEAYGEDPNQFAANAYDSIYAIYDACVAGSVTADMSADEICEILKTQFTSMTFNGLTGSDVTWSADGAPTKAPIIFKIENGIYVPVD